PITIGVLGSVSLASWARPTVPPAPGTLDTDAVLTIFSPVSTSEKARPVWSQPPPGSAGTTMLTLSGAALEDESEPLSTELQAVSEAPATAVARAIAAVRMRGFTGFSFESDVRHFMAVKVGASRRGPEASGGI